MIGWLSSFKGLPPLAPNTRRGGSGESIKHRLMHRWKRRGPVAPGGSERIRADSTGLLRQYASLLQSGRTQAQAWEDLRSHWRSRDPQHPLAILCERVFAAEHAGLGVEVGLRRALKSSNAKVREDSKEVPRAVIERLVSVHALSQTTGAPLAGLCRQAAASLEEAAALHAAIRASSAGPRLTQHILTLLPIGGLFMGMLMGGSPVGVLLGTALGWACLITGLGILVFGRLWSDRMIRGVARDV